MLWSICIATIRTRAQYLGRMLARIEPQLVDGVELLIAEDNGGRSIGSKRNLLLAESTGDYVSFVDDDDLVPADFVSRIVLELKHKPDCVGFKVRRFNGGDLYGYGIHSLTYTKYGQRNIGPDMVYERTPNHLNPVRRDLALQAGFPDKDNMEDAAYAFRLRPLLNTERFIDAFMYDYLYRRPDQRPGERVHKTI